MQNLILIIAIGCGGALGAITRAVIKSTVSAKFPWATLIANSLGSFIAGILYFSFKSEWWHLGILVGFCGSLTTFSTFALETVLLADEHRFKSAILNLLLNLIIPFFAIALSQHLVSFLE